MEAREGKRPERVCHLRSQLSAPRPPHPVLRADGAEHRHRAAAGRHHCGADSGRRRRQRPRQGGLLQPQVPARRLLLWWVPPRPARAGGRGLGGERREEAGGRGRPVPPREDREASASTGEWTGVGTPLRICVGSDVSETWKDRARTREVAEADPSEQDRHGGAGRRYGGGWERLRSESVTWWS